MNIGLVKSNLASFCMDGKEQSFMVTLLTNPMTTKQWKLEKKEQIKQTKYLVRQGTAQVNVFCEFLCSVNFHN